MLLKYQYSSEDEKKSILQENAGKFLIEEQHLITGHFLIFTDVATIETEVSTIKERLTLSESAIDFLIMGGM
jgi:hypothetical protein